MPITEPSEKCLLFTIRRVWLRIISHLVKMKRNFRFICQISKPSSTDSFGIEEGGIFFIYAAYMF